MIRQITDRYNQLSIELENSSKRSIEIIDGSLNSLNEKLMLIDQVVAENEGLLNNGS